jgi:hypothetical protein
MFLETLLPKMKSARKIVARRFNAIAEKARL